MSKLIGSVVDNTLESLSNAVLPSPSPVGSAGTPMVGPSVEGAGASLLGAAGASGEGASGVVAAAGAIMPPAGASLLGNRLGGLE